MGQTVWIINRDTRTSSYLAVVPAIGEETEVRLWIVDAARKSTSAMDPNSVTALPPVLSETSSGGCRRMGDAPDDTMPLFKAGVRTPAKGSF